MESDKHRELILQIRSWVQCQYPELVAYLDDDLDSHIGRGRPPIIAGFRPDAFVPGSRQRTTIIGEAKTESDLDTTHTRRQLEAYIDYLGRQPSGILVISTEWRARRTAKSLVKQLIRQSQSRQVITHTITDIEQYDDIETG